MVHTRAHADDRASLPRPGPRRRATATSRGGVSTPALVVARADGRARQGRRRPRVPRLRRRDRLPEPRPRPSRGRRGDPRAGRPLPPPVLHGRRRTSPTSTLCRRLAELCPARRRARSRSSSTPAPRRSRTPSRSRAPRPAGRPSSSSTARSTAARLLTMAMTGKLVYKQGFGPLAPDVYRAPAPYPLPRRLDARTRSRASSCSSSRTSTRDSVACVVLEPVQGEGGFIPMPPEFVRALRRALRRARDPLRRRRGAVRLRAHRHDVGDRAARRRARPARLGQDARRRPPARAVTGRAELMDAVHVGRARRHLRRQSRSPAPPRSPSSTS